MRDPLGIAKRHSDGLSLDGLVIELTGVADPAPVVQTFMAVEEVCDAFYVDNVGSGHSCE